MKGEARSAYASGRSFDGLEVAKHFRLDIREAGLSYAREEVKSAEEAALDGIVVRTSVQKAALDTEEAVPAYEDLGHVGRRFAATRPSTSRLRPIHSLANRVRAHVFLCMLAYYVEWHMRQALAPALRR